MPSLLKKFLEFAIGNGVIMLIGFITSPIVTRLMDTKEYGKASMFTTFTSLLLVIIMMGMDQGYIRFFNEENEKNRGLLLKKVIGLTFISNCVVAFLLIFFYKKVSTFVVGEVSILVVLLIIIENTQNIISSFSLIHVRMQQKGALYSFANIIYRVAYLIIIILLVKILQGKYITILIALVFSNLIRIIFLFIKEKSLYKTIFLNNNKESLNTKSIEIIKYGMPFIFSMAITWVFQSIDKISIRMFLGYEAVGIYAVAMSIISIINGFQGAFTTFWTPVAYERYAKDKECKDFFRTINTYVTIGMFFLAIMLILFKDIIVLILGKNYREAVYIIPMLTFMPVMYTISETTVLGINFKKKTKYHIYISIIAAIVNLIGNILLVPILGAKGAAISTAISYFIFFIARTIISEKLYKINFKIKPLFFTSISVVIFAIYSSFSEFNILNIILGALCILVLIITYRDDLREILNIIKHSIKTNKS